MKGGQEEEKKEKEEGEGGRGENKEEEEEEGERKQEELNYHLPPVCNFCSIPATRGAFAKSPPSH
jgi:hypothetical protein